jgi:hypothetical protein
MIRLVLKDSEGVRIQELLRRSRAAADQLLLAKISDQLYSESRNSRDDHENDLDESDEDEELDDEDGGDEDEEGELVATG